MTSGASLSAALSRCGWRERRMPRSLVFVAHPDDEAIALGGQLRELRPLIVHATDGAPRDLRDARALGFANAAEYAQTRRRELRAAMSLAGIGWASLLSLGFPDQGAAHRLVALTRAFVDVLAEHRPELVFTHAFEGGHPDHDAVAFAAHAAVKLGQGQGVPPPLLLEAPLYHSQGGACVRQRFAPGSEAPTAVVELTPQQRELKQRMLAAHATQGQTLAGFELGQEWLRRAAPVDFNEPPNGGDVYYERFDWKCTPAQFGALAREALAQLELPPCL